MKLAKLSLALVAVAGLAACEGGGRSPDKGTDFGTDKKDLSTLIAGIWVDPNGCDNWIIDDGFEGYFSARLDKYGKPVCSGAAPANVATGPWRGGATDLFSK
jgi:hypothetical protein